MRHPFSLHGLHMTFVPYPSCAYSACGIHVLPSSLHTLPMTSIYQAFSLHDVCEVFFLLQPLHSLPVKSMRHLLCMHTLPMTPMCQPFSLHSLPMTSICHTLCLHTLPMTPMHDPVSSHTLTVISMSHPSPDHPYDVHALPHFSCHALLFTPTQHQFYLFYLCVGGLVSNQLYVRNRVFFSSWGYLFGSFWGLWVFLGNSNHPLGPD